VFPGFEGPIKAVHIAKNGRTALATDGAKLLQIDLMKREVMRERTLNRSWAAGQAAAFTADGNFVAASDGRKINVWNLNSAGQMPACEDNDLVWSLVFTPDGDRLLAGGRTRVSVWDFRKQRKVYSQATAGNGYLKSIAVTADSKHMAAIPSSAGQALQIFRLP
jgi:WD40 repeat protein